MTERVQIFKEAMHISMVKNYEKDGHLAPVFFGLTTQGPIFQVIPRELLIPENKEKLAIIIKQICKNPLVVAAGLILEAYGAMIHKDSEMAKLVLNGDMDMKDIKDKHDIIIMLFSTPEEEEFIAYFVDEKRKAITGKFSEEQCKDYSGTFSHFFNWNKN